MGIGVVEILIVVAIILIVFGGYKRLPQLGRSAGTGVRKGGVKAKEIAERAHARAEEVDTKKLSESVGKGIREAREVRDSVKGIASDEEPAREPAKRTAGGEGSGDAGNEPAERTEPAEPAEPTADAGDERRSEP